MTAAEPGVTAELAAGGVRLEQRAMGEVVIRAGPDNAVGVATSQELTLRFASDDAVAVSG
jgi:hypothetical protein